MTTGSAGFHGGVANKRPITPPSEHDILLAELKALRIQLAAAVVPTVTASMVGDRTTHQPHGYCWTHGSSNNVAHTSLTCLNKAEGHQDAATTHNKMGGSTHHQWGGAPGAGASGVGQAI